MILFKVFSLTDKNVEKDLAQVFTEFGGSINKEDIYAFSDKLGFLLNTDDDETKAKKLTVHAFKRELKSLRVQVAMAEKALEMIKRKVASGVKGSKPDDVLDAHEVINEKLAEIDYNIAAIKKIEDDLNAKKA